MIEKLKQNQMKIIIALVVIGAVIAYLQQ